MFGGSDGNDGLLLGVAVFCTVMSLVSTLLISALLPSLALGYSYDDVQSAREEVVSFTGDTMTNVTPWELTAVYTPYQVGSAYNVDDDGFLYGSSITGYSEIGKHAYIKLDPEKKSSTTLDNGKTTVTETRTLVKPIYVKTGPIGLAALYGQFKLGEWVEGFADFTGLDVSYDPDVFTTKTTTSEYQTWQYTGYRYLFDPMLPIDYSGQGDDKTSAVDGSLSIVWYKNPLGEGLSGGLVIYDKDQVIISNYAASDIISDYNTTSAKATKYNFVFEGITLQLNILFDEEVLNESIPLEEAWTKGKWTMAITSPSAGNFLDLKNSTSFTSSLGDMVNTFIDIYTFDVPNVDNWFYELVLWLLVVFPAELALLLFLKSVFGMAGVGAGILGTLLTWVI